MNHSQSIKLKRLQSKDRSLKYRKCLENYYEEAVSSIKLSSSSSSSSCSSSSSSSSSYIDSDRVSDDFNDSDVETVDRDEFDNFENNSNDFFDEERELNECFNETNADKFIYSGSNVYLNEFCVVFLTLIHRLKVSENGINMLLKFLVSILPPDNIIPNSYRKLLKSFDIRKMKPIHICSFCSKRIERNSKCSSNECVSKMRKKQNRNIIDPIIFEFKYVEHLKTILENNWSIIVDYRNVLTRNTVSDICNSGFSRNMEISFNTISFLLFVDGASFNKSLSGTVWAIMAMVCNLPPILRTTFYNIIKLIYINGTKFNFNSIFENYLNDFKNLLKNGIIIESLNLTIKIFIHGLISDSPARSKVCNTKQFNGEYGCLFCLHPGQNLKRTRVYPYSKNIYRLRDNGTYNLALENLNSKGESYCGIKGTIVLF
jgi:hypothetical protein